MSHYTIMKLSSRSWAVHNDTSDTMHSVWSKREDALKVSLDLNKKTYYDVSRPTKGSIRAQKERIRKELGNV